MIVTPRVGDTLRLMSVRRLSVWERLRSYALLLVREIWALVTLITGIGILGISALVAHAPISGWGWSFVLLVALAVAQCLVYLKTASERDRLADDFARASAAPRLQMMSFDGTTFSGINEISGNVMTVTSSADTRTGLGPITEEVVGKSFIGEAVVLDGKNFASCLFVDVSLIFEGRAVFSLSGNTFRDGIQFDFSRCPQASVAAQLLDGLGFVQPPRD